MADHYCNRRDIESQLSQYTFINSTDKPNRQQLLAIIERVANDMDSHLSILGFTIPITSGDNSLKILRGICVNGSAATVIESIASNQVIKKSTIPRWEWLWKKYEAGMKRIEANSKILEDAGNFSEKAQFESYQRVTTDPSADERFEIGEKF